MKRDPVIEIEAAEALLDLGVRLPLFIKMPFGRRLSFRLTMRRPTLGSCIQIAKLYLSMGVTADEIEKFNKHEEIAFIALHGDTVSKMVALTICRGYFASRLFSGVVAWIIRNLTDEHYLSAASRAIVRCLGTRNFINIIRSAEAANPLKPTLSQERLGS